MRDEYPLCSTIKLSDNVPYGAAKDVIPSLYLSSNVEILDGTGASNNPYKLKIVNE